MSSLEPNNIASLVRAALAARTPEDTALIVVHLPRLRARLAALTAAFPKGTLHAIAIKTHPHPRMLRFLVEQGFGLEAASIEEVDRALAAGCPTEKLVFDSPVKTQREIDRVSQMPGMLVNVNSLSELERYPEQIACKLGIRINPEVHTGAPELFDVSSKESKFGVPASMRDAIVNAALRYPVTALHMHSGSQMKDLDVQEAALKSLLDLALEINSLNAGAITTLDIGGGLPSEPLTEGTVMNSYGSRVGRVFKDQSFELVTEFGQWVHAECGVALSTIEYVLAPGRLFLHLGADFFMRDAYTKARKFPLAVWSETGEVRTGELHPFDLAGPLCFAGDYLAHQVPLPAHIKEGDVLSVDETGANTYALWSRHCSRTIPKVISWDGKAVEVWSDRHLIQY